MKQVDEEIINICDRMNFPLIVAGGDVSYVEIMNPIMSRLYKPEISAVDYSNLGNEFLDLIIDEDDIQVIYSKIAAGLGLTLSLFDVYYGCIYTNKAPALVEEERRYLQKNMGEVSLIASESHYVYVDSDGALNIIYLIKSKRNFFGYIVLLVDEQARMEQYLEVAARLSLASSLIFNKQNKLSEISDVQQEEYVVNLLVWNFATVDIAVKEGANLGYHIVGKNTLIVVNVNQFNFLQYDSEKLALTTYVKKWIFPSISDMVRGCGATNFACFHSDTILLFLESDGDQRLLDSLCGKIVTLFQKSNRSTVSIGISERYDAVTDTPEAYNQAFHAAIMGRQLYGDGAVIRFEDIFYFYQIKAMSRHGKNRAFCKKLVAPILAYDQAKGTDLMGTFEKLVLLSSDVNTMAEKLFIHRNTLLYRKNRIIDILGLNPFEMPHLFNYTIAFLVLADPDYGEPVSP